jgi:maltose alpha-D-glucosyltransferase/alpha-amylase
MRDDPQWFKDAVFYEVYVRGFFDSNGDGHGDIPGLIDKLDYIRDLGVDCIWLLPIHPSPGRDDGYDVTDLRAVHPDYGTIADVDRLLREAHARGLRVIADLVMNHVSADSAWFRSARASRSAPFRDYFVWSDTPDRYRQTRIIFQDTEASNWTFDRATGQYYWHRFFDHQPDLNFDNPAVQDEMLAVAETWLARGFDGFRCDAVAYLFEREGTNGENLPETHAYLKRLRKLVDEHFHGRVLVAEVNQWPEEMQTYFGDGDEFHMAFAFPLMPRLFMALRKESRAPIVEILERTPPIHPNCQWATFLRNHDELSLEMVTDAERDYLLREYAPEPRMRLNLGIRRRLAPLLNGSRRRLELLHAILLSMPGSPFLYYGDEIGMGDNVHLPDRRGVRTPMQWSAERNAGFSRAEPQRLYCPVCVDGVFHYEAVNVDVELRSESSFLRWLRSMLRLRREIGIFGRANLVLLRPPNEAIFAYVRELDGKVVLAVNNLSRYVQPVELDLSPWTGRIPVELIGRTRFAPIRAQTLYSLTLGPHGFYWLCLDEAATPTPEGEGARSR